MDRSGSDNDSSGQRFGRPTVRAGSYFGIERAPGTVSTRIGHKGPSMQETHCIYVKAIHEKAEEHVHKGRGSHCNYAGFPFNCLSPLRRWS